MSSFFKKTGPDTHRFYYINGVMEFGLFTDKETDPKQIFKNFLACETFNNFKRHWGSEWDRLKLISYDLKTNSMYMESHPDDISAEDKNQKYTSKRSNKPTKKSKSDINTTSKEVKESTSTQPSTGKKSLI